MSMYSLTRCKMFLMDPTISHSRGWFRQQEQSYRAITSFCERVETRAETALLVKRLTNAGR